MKKVLSLLLVLTLVLSMSVTSFAAKNALKDKDSAGGFAAIDWDMSDKGDATQSGNEVDFGTVRPGDVYTFQLSTLAFTVMENSSKVTTLSATHGLTKKELGSKVTSRVRVSKGSNTIKEAVFNYDGYRVSATDTTKTASVKIEFVKPFRNNDEDGGVAFDIWVYPVVDGTVWTYDTKGINFIGELENDHFVIDEGTDYADMYTGNIAKADATVRSLEYDLGPDGSDHDISIFGRAVKGVRYWGVANQDVSEADDETMNANDIYGVYNLNVINLDNVADYVSFNNLTSADYVFDGELNFLGNGNSKTIPFRTKYYIADHMIEVAADDEPIGDDEPVGDELLDPIVDPPATGGDVSAPAGIFDNPSTGA